MPSRPLNAEEKQKISGCFQELLCDFNIAFNTQANALTLKLQQQYFTSNPALTIKEAIEATSNCIEEIEDELPSETQDECLINKTLRDTMAELEVYLTAHNKPEFQEGDLIYGLSDSRESFICQYNIHEALSITTIDAINNTFLGIGNQYLINKQQVYRFNYVGKTDSESLRTKDFREYLERHLKYSPLKTQGDTEGEIKKRIVRACKAGIEYTIAKGNKIHFILDRIDMAAMVEKYYIDALGQKQKPYTGSELRFIYRNHLKPEFSTNICYWRYGEETIAPWDEDPILWSRYHPKSEHFLDDNSL